MSRAVATSRPLQSLAVLLLTSGICASALAATSPTTACDRTPTLQSLEVPVRELSTNAVGHVFDESDDGDGASLEPLPAQLQSPALILDLTPRMAIILQDVFSAVAIETPPLAQHDQEPGSVIETVPQDESPLSPVAGDAGQPESGEPTGQDAKSAQEQSVPSFQHKMLRTDI